MFRPFYYAKQQCSENCPHDSSVSPEMSPPLFLCTKTSRYWNDFSDFYRTLPISRDAKTGPRTTRILFYFCNFRFVICAITCPKARLLGRSLARPRKLGSESPGEPRTCSISCYNGWLDGRESESPIEVLGKLCPSFDQLIRVEWTRKRNEY